MANHIQHFGRWRGDGRSHNREHDYSCAPHVADVKEANQRLGRSRAGFWARSTPFAMPLRNPLHFILAGGERHDCTQALALLEGLKSEAVLAGKGDDVDCIVKAVEKMVAVAVIPPKFNRKSQREYERGLYRSEI